MLERHFNWKLAAVLLIGLVVLCVTAFSLRQWQRRNRADEGLRLGNIAYNEHRWEEAAKQLGRYVGVRSDDHEALLKYAEAQLNIRPRQLNNLMQAEGAYRTIMRGDPNSTDPNTMATATTKLCTLYLSGKDTSGEAELIARRYLETGKDIRIRILLALSLEAQRKFSEATDVLKQVIEKAPNEVDAYERLGWFAEQRPQEYSETAEFWYNEAIKANPSSAHAYIARGDYYFRRNNKIKALEDLGQAEKLDLSNPKDRMRLAGSLITAGNLNRAEEHLKQLRAITPADPILWRTWADLAFISNSKEKMLRVAQDGLQELSAQPWDFTMFATELFIKGGDLERARKCIENLEKKEMSPGNVAFLSGLVADSEGNTTAAVNYWAKSLELGNIRPSVRLSIRLDLSSALAKLGDTPSALRQLRSLVVEEPTYGPGHFALSKLLLRTGDLNGSLEQARRAVQLNPENYEAALVELQAMIQLRASEEKNSDWTWEDLEQKLTQLEQRTGNTLDVRLLGLNLATLKGDFTKAERLFAELKQDYPDEIAVAIADARLLVSQEKYSQAILALSKAINRLPVAYEPAAYLASILERQNDLQQCEAVLISSMERAGQPVVRRKLSLLLAQYYRRWNEKDKSLKLLESLAKELPNDIPVKRALLQCEQITKDVQKTQQLVDEIKTIEGSNGWRWRYEQARLWFVSENFSARRNEVISLLRENIQDNPDDQNSRLLLAATYERGGQSSELKMAISIYSEAHSKSPDDTRVIASYVTALYRDNKFEEAEKILNEAFQRSLDNSILHKLQLEGYLRRGELGLASDILQDFISTDPNDVSSRLNLAMLKIHQKHYAEAGDLLEKLKAQLPDWMPVTAAQIKLKIQENAPEEAVRLCDEEIKRQDSASAHMLRARAHSSMRQFDEAAKDLEIATAIEPNNVEAWIDKSDFYSVTDQSQKAIASIERALALSPDSFTIQQRAVSLLLASGNRENIRQAGIIIDRALRILPENSSLKLLKARSLLAERTQLSTNEAIQILEGITVDEPKAVDAWTLLGKILLSQGKFDKAGDQALQGLVHNTNNRDLLTIRAEAELKRWSPAVSIPTFKQVLSLEPNDLDAALRLADVYIQADEPAESEKLVRQYLPLVKDSRKRTEFILGLAIALYKQGNESEAKKEFDSIAQADPNDPRPMLEQIKLLRDQQLWSQAEQEAMDWHNKHPKNTGMLIYAANSLLISKLKHPSTPEAAAQQTAENLLRVALEKDPNSTSAILSLGTLLQVAGRTDQAATFYEKLLRIDPNSVTAMNNLAWILCEDKGKPEEAMKLTQQGLKITPNYVDLMDTMGVVYYRLGQFSRAVDSFTKCLRFYRADTPEAVTCHFHMARALAELGQNGEAVKHLTKAMQSTNGLSLSQSDTAEAKRLLKRLSSEGS